MKLGLVAMILSSPEDLLVAMILVSPEVVLVANDTTELT